MEQTAGGEHGQTTVLKLLQLLFLVLLGSVVETERVVAAFALSKVVITWDVALSSVSEILDTALFDKTKVNAEKDGGKDICTGIVDIGLLHIEESSKETWPEETNDSHHRDTSVDEFGFTIPSESINGGEVRIRRRGECRSLSNRGESDGVEASITDETSVEVFWALLPWKGR